MSYQPGIPTGFIGLNEDYLNIQNNFTELNTQFSVDHDLGTDLDGHDVATFIEQMVYEKKIPMPKWNIHSANPVGEAEIAAAMKSAERFAK